VDFYQEFLEDDGYGVQGVQLHHTTAEDSLDEDGEEEQLLRDALASASSSLVTPSPEGLLQEDSGFRNEDGGCADAEHGEQEGLAAGSEGSQGLQLQLLQRPYAARGGSPPGLSPRQQALSPARRRASALELVRRFREAPPMPREERPRLGASPPRAPAAAPPPAASLPLQPALPPGQQPAHASPARRPSAGAGARTEPAGRLAQEPAAAQQLPDQLPVQQPEQQQQEMMDVADQLLERCRRLLQGGGSPTPQRPQQRPGPAAASPPGRKVDWRQVLASGSSTLAAASPARASQQPPGRPAASAAAQGPAPPLTLEEIKAKYLGMQQAAAQRRPPPPAAAPSAPACVAPWASSTGPQPGPSAWREKLVRACSLLQCSSRARSPDYSKSSAVCWACAPASAGTPMRWAAAAWL
jgi:hypothetical protein